ncbi:LAFA_0F11650g1_1 [Lachancea sp. 'fantastica']|nr:LAFA_0F11650g1_1 [Lachancea sp. 'fantastica']
MAMQIQIDTASSSQDPSSTVSYAFLGGSTGGVLSLDQSQMLSTTAVSTRPRFTRSRDGSMDSDFMMATSTLSGSASASTPASLSASASSSSNTGASSSSSTIPKTATTAGSTSASPSVQHSNGAALGAGQALGFRSNGSNWKLGAAITLLTVCGALSV